MEEEDQELQGLQVTARDTAAVEREVMLATAPELLAATTSSAAAIARADSSVQVRGGLR